MKQTITLVTWALISAVTFSDTYYMNAANPAGGDGKTPQTAWKTIDEAVSVLNALPDKGAGDTVKLADGEYGHFRMTFVNRTDWLTFKADDGATPVFSQGIQVGDYGDTSTFYLQFEGLTIRMNPDTRTAFYAKCSDSAINESASFLKLINCRFPGTGYEYKPVETWTSAITLLGVSHVTVDGCRIYADVESGITDGWTEGIQLPNRNSNGFNWVNHDIVIKNCDIQDCRFGMDLKGKDIRIEKNHIHEIGDDGVRIGYAENLFVIGNEIHNIQCPADTDWHNDCIQVTPYKDTHTFNNVVFTQNICYDTNHQVFFFEHFVSTAQRFYIVNNVLIAQDNGWALAVENMNNLVVANNTLHGIARFKDTTNYRVHNNVLGWLGLTDPENSGIDSHNAYTNIDTAFTGSNNIYYPGLELLMKKPVIDGQNTTETDFGFAITDPANNPMLAAALPLSQIITDWPLPDVPLDVDVFGTPRKSCPDMGGYENQTCGCRDENDGNGTSTIPDALAHWTFNEGGNTALDHSKNAIDGTLVGVERRPEEPGTVYFNGSDSYIDCGVPTLSQLNIGMKMTIAAWIKIQDPERNAFMRIISKKATWDAKNGFELEYNPKQNWLTMLGSSNNFARAQVDLDTGLHLVVAVIDGTQAALYVDGKDMTSDSSIDMIAPNEVPLQIGRQSGSGDYFQGYIDEIVLLNTALTPTEVKALFDRKPSQETAMIHYPFDDMQDSQVADDSTLQQDGTALNAPVWGTAWKDGRQEWLTFNGTTQAVQIPTASLNPETGSLVLWAQPTSETGPQFLFGHILDESNRIWLYTVAGQLALGMGSSSTVAANIAALSPDQLYHIALTWNAGTYCVYVDGQAVSTGTYTGLETLADTADIANMGTDAYRSEGLGFNGNVEDVRIFQHCLSAEEVGALTRTYDIRANHPLTIQISGSNETGTPLTFTPGSLPAGAWFDTVAQQLHWRPWYNQTGSQNIELTAQDGTAQTITVVTRQTAMSDWYRDFLRQTGKY